jgi:hypothetical protein
MILNFLYIDQFNNTYYVRGNVGDRPPVVVRYNEKINRWMYESVVSHKIVSPFDKSMVDDLARCYNSLGECI